MPRLPRLDLAGQAQHVIQRGTKARRAKSIESDPIDSLIVDNADPGAGVAGNWNSTMSANYGAYWGGSWGINGVRLD